MALSTGGVKHGVVKIGSVLAEATGATTVLTYPIASNSTLGVDARIMYQRTTNADNGFKWLTGLIVRQTGSASVVADSEITDAIMSWAQGAASLTVSGSILKLSLAVTGQPVRIVGKLNVIEVKQPYIVA